MQTNVCKQITSLDLSKLQEPTVAYITEIRSITNYLRIKGFEPISDRESPSYLMNILNLIESNESLTIESLKFRHAKYSRVQLARSFKLCLFRFTVSLGHRTRVD